MSEIEAYVAEVRQARRPDDQVAALSAVFTCSLAPLLDEMGIGEDAIPDGQPRSTQWAKDEHYFEFGLRGYRVPHGLFPVFDEFMERWRANPISTGRVTPAQGFPGPPKPWPLDERFLADVALLAERGQAAIARRRHPY